MVSQKCSLSSTANKLLTKEAVLAVLLIMVSQQCYPSITANKLLT